MEDSAASQVQTAPVSVYDQLLVADFNQCYQHVRFYEETFRKILEFGIGLVIAAGAAYAALVTKYEFTATVETEAGLLLGFATLPGVMLVFALARNRVYFTFMCRYVNEIRHEFLSHSPAGVSNKAGMYSDHRFPRVMDRASIHTILLYFLCFCNALMFAAFLGTVPVAWHRFSTPRMQYFDMWRFGVGLVVATALQISSVLLYWRSKEQAGTADAAVFGGEI